jgi:thioredoxin-related protein
MIRAYMNRMLRNLFLVLIAAIALAATPLRAAELVMFERAGCPWCEAFNREIAPIYPKTQSGKRAPLRRVNIYKPMPADLAFIQRERFTPVFVLIDNGKELGRIRGYPGEANFWGLFDALVTRTLPPQSSVVPEKPLRGNS